MLEKLGKMLPGWLQQWLGLTPKQTTTASASPAASDELSSPFLLGLDDVKNLESLSTENFLKLIQWHEVSQTSSQGATLEDMLGNFPE